MWHVQLCHGTEAIAAGMPGAAEKGSEAEQVFRQENEPIVTGLIRSAEVLVACDPGRVTYEPGLPSVIWAWAVLGRDCVYQVGIKRSAVRTGIAEDIVRDLLGSRLDRHQATVMDLVDMGRLNLIPRSWHKQEQWMSVMRRLSQSTLRAETIFHEVARHILDPNREPWLPSSKRAA